MVRFLAHRALSGLVAAFVVATLVFFVVQTFGPDPARSLLGKYANADTIARKQHELGVDRPVAVQFADWLGGVLTGDLGHSWATTRTVSSALADAVPITLTIATGALLLAGLLAVVLGIAAAERGGWIDAILQVLVVVGFAVPGFWLALVLASTLAVQLGWFPATGYTPPSVSIGGWLRSITLPIAALCVSITAALAQQLRNSILEVSRQDFVRTLRSQGIPQRTILFRHILRNAASPMLTVASLQFIGALSGAVIIERVFGLRGIGSLLETASAKGDLPILMGVVLFSVVAVVIVNLVIDIAIGWVNPKVRVR